MTSPVRLAAASALIGLLTALSPIVKLQAPTETLAVQSSQPSQQAQPGKPAQSGQPTQPSQPSEPAQSTQPNQPVQTREPVQPNRPVTPPAPRVMQMPPERKLILEALVITDPQKKIDALDKIIQDHPKSPDLARAYQVILETVIKTWPDQKKQVLDRANKMIKAAPEAARASVYNAVAVRLLDAGLYLDEAEKFAKKGLGRLDEKEYLDDMRRLQERPGAPRLPENLLIERFRSNRANTMTTLGRIYLKRGKDAEAEKLLEEVHATNPELTAASVALAEIAAKAGRNEEALGYLTKAALSGRITTETRRKLHEVYAKTHGGSVAGLDDYLDAEYKKAFPNPVAAMHYKRTDSRTDRVVLAEVFTGASCPPCVAADLAMDGVLERYSRKDVVMLMYHLHIPGPDPMTNPMTQKRQRYYAVGGVPSVFIDGEADNRGGGSRSAAPAAYDRYASKIDKRLESPSDAKLNLDARQEGSIVTVNASVENVKDDQGQIKLHIALAEQLIRYSGENGVRFHPMVVRSLAGPDAAGFQVEPGKPASAEHKFDIGAITAELKKHLDDFEKARTGFSFSEKKHEIDTGKLAVVAFLQDEKSKRVLQSAYVRLSPSGGGHQ